MKNNLFMKYCKFYCRPVSVTSNNSLKALLAKMLHLFKILSACLIVIVCVFCVLVVVFLHLCFVNMRAVTLLCGGYPTPCCYSYTYREVSGQDRCHTLVFDSDRVSFMCLVLLVFLYFCFANMRAVTLLCGGYPTPCPPDNAQNLARLLLLGHFYIFVI